MQIIKDIYNIYDVFFCGLTNVSDEKIRIITDPPYKRAWMSNG